MWGNPVKPKKYTPMQLWKEACNYFNWCDNNPWMMIEQSKQPQRLPTNYDKAKHGNIKNFLNQTVKLPHQRPYSIERLCNFLNISFQTFENYSKTEGYETYFEVSARIRQIIDAQHFEGGMVGAFNANIVTRKLGLAEKQELAGANGKGILDGIEFKIGLKDTTEEDDDDQIDDIVK